MKITKNSRPTIYRKMMNLLEQKFVGKGCKSVNADTFYLLEKGNKIVEESELCTSSLKNIGCNTIISYDNDSVRSKLIDIMDQGLLLKAIAVNVGISESELSRFKNGVNVLKESDVEILSEYLNEVHIPQWKNISPDKRKSTKLDMLRKRMKNKNM